MTPRPRLGIVGGTFDPIHLGHVQMALAAASCAELDRVLIVPAGVPPHRGEIMAPAADRLAMCRLAVRDQATLEVSDAEVLRSGPSYTSLTLADVAADQVADLFLVLGWDAARALGSWHRPDEVLRLARLVLVPRPGLPVPGRAALIAAGIDPARAQLCEARTPDIRATEIRRRVAAGDSLAGMVDAKVEAYIRRHRLYGAQVP